MPESAIDAIAMIDQLRRREPGAVDQAYKVTFGSDLGRMILADHLVECGVGNALGPDVTAYAAGLHDGALMLAAKAGFDQAALAVATITDQLTGESDGSFSDGYTPPPDDDLMG